jgi:hypothetical protein
MSIVGAMALSTTGISSTPAHKNTGIFVLPFS